MRVDLTPDQVRGMWRRRSLSGPWTHEDDWWTPAVDVVAEAMVRGRRAGPACALLGRARARAGVGVGEALEDLGMLYAALGWDEPPLSAVRALAEGWSEGGLTAVWSASCEDPVTGMANLAYLRTRLAELYREARAEGSAPRRTHCLVVIDGGDGADPWGGVARTVRMGHNLRAVFTGGETRALLGSGRAAALVRKQDKLALQTAALRRAYSRANRARIWTEDLPHRLEQALRLLDGLAR